MFDVSLTFTGERSIGEADDCATTGAFSIQIGRKPDVFSMMPLAIAWRVRPATS